MTRVGDIAFNVLQESKVRKSREWSGAYLIARPDMVEGTQAEWSDSPDAGDCVAAIPTAGLASSAGDKKLGRGRHVARALDAMLRPHDSILRPRP